MNKIMENNREIPQKIIPRNAELFNDPTGHMSQAPDEISMLKTHLHSYIQWAI